MAAWPEAVLQHQCHPPCPVWQRAWRGRFPANSQAWMRASVPASRSAYSRRVLLAPMEPVPLPPQGALAACSCRVTKRLPHSRRTGRATTAARQPRGVAACHPDSRARLRERCQCNDTAYHQSRVLWGMHPGRWRQPGTPGMCLALPSASAGAHPLYVRFSTRSLAGRMGGGTGRVRVVYAGWKRRRAPAAATMEPGWKWSGVQ